MRKSFSFLEEWCQRQEIAAVVLKRQEIAAMVLRQRNPRDRGGFSYRGHKGSVSQVAIVIG